MCRLDWLLPFPMPAVDVSLLLFLRLGKGVRHDGIITASTEGVGLRR